LFVLVMTSFSYLPMRCLLLKRHSGYREKPFIAEGTELTVAGAAPDLQSRVCAPASRLSHLSKKQDGHLEGGKEYTYTAWLSN